MGTYCGRCKKYTDNVTLKCPHHCKICYQPLRTHKDEDCWFGDDDKSVKVAKAEVETENVNVENNTISADPVVIGGYKYVEAEPMREVRTINVSLDSITVDENVSAEEVTKEEDTEEHTIGNAEEASAEVEEEVRHIKLSSDRTPLMHVWGSKSGRGVKLQTVSILADTGCSINIISKDLADKLNLKTYEPEVKYTVRDASGNMMTIE